MVKGWFKGASARKSLPWCAKDVHFNHIPPPLWNETTPNSLYFTPGVIKQRLSTTEWFLFIFSHSKRLFFLGNRYFSRFSDIRLLNSFNHITPSYYHEVPGERDSKSWSVIAANNTGETCFISPKASRNGCHANLHGAWSVPELRG